MRLPSTALLVVALGLTVSACTWFESDQQIATKIDTKAEPKQSQTPVPAAPTASGRDEANWAKMEAFLAANKTKPGVTVQPSGVQWRVVKKGDGSPGKPRADSTVTVRYKGTLIDGTVFDQTDPNAPAAIFNLKSLIKGWQEVIPLMGRGDKVEIVLPSDLAYGPKGSSDGSIKPDQVLVFEIELLDFL